MFLTQIKKGLGLLAVLLLLSSCSEYQQVLKKGDLAAKTKAAEDYYKAGDYKKASRVLELIIPAYRGKPQGERVLFWEADSYYNLGDYYLSSYKFERFSVAFPKSEKKEEADFKHARSVYELSAPYTLDQTETYEGIDKLQKFINNNPESEFLADANKYAGLLQKKLERKNYEIAKRFHHRKLYKSAIKAFDNYLIDYPGSDYTEEALYYKLESAYELAINSFEQLVKERLKTARKYCGTYLENGKDENYIKNAQRITEDIKKRLEPVN